MTTIDSLACRHSSHWPHFHSPIVSFPSVPSPPPGPVAAAAAAAMTPLGQAKLILFISALGCIASGSLYSISAWSPQLKTELNCSQSAIEVVGTLGNVGAYLGPVSGVLIQSLSVVWVSVICIGCTTISLVPMALAVLDRSGGFFSHFRNTTALGGFWALQAFSSNTTFTMLMGINLGNVPTHRRGIVLASLATLFGFSAAIYTLFYNDILDQNIANFLFFLCALVVAASVAVAAFVRRIDPDVWLGDSGLDVALLGSQGEPFAPEKASINADGVVHVDSEDQYALQMSESFLALERDAAGLTSGLTSRSSSVDEIPPEHLDEEEARVAFLAAQDFEQLLYHGRVCGGGSVGRLFGSLWFLMHKPVYWAMFVSVFLISGGGLMLINNAGHVVQSLNGGEQDASLTTILILVLSACNGTGRMLMGLSDLKPWRRGVWLLMVAVLMSLTHFANAFLFTSKHHVVFSVMGVGLAYGGLWSIIPILISDNFGVPNFSINLGWISIVSGPASIFFNHFAGTFYDNHTVPGTNSCVGSHCYRDSFIMCGCSSAIAALIVCAMIPSTRKIVPKHHRHHDAALK